MIINYTTEVNIGSDTEPKIVKSFGSYNTDQVMNALYNPKNGYLYIALGMTEDYKEENYVPVQVGNMKNLKVEARKQTYSGTRAKEIVLKEKEDINMYLTSTVNSVLAASIMNEATTSVIEDDSTATTLVEDLREEPMEIDFE